MKVKNLSALAGLGGALILSSSTDAAFIGLELVNVTNMFVTHPNPAVQASAIAGGVGTTYQVYRAFAAFTDTTPQDRVNAVYGNGANPASFTIVGGTVYNYIEGTDGGSSIPHFDLPPSNFSNAQNIARSWDTWATINRAGAPNVAGNPPGTSPGGTFFSPFAHEDSDGNLQQFGHFLGSYVVDDAAWYISPPDHPQGLAVNTWGASGQGLNVPKVLLMQITVTTGSFFSGKWNVSTGFGEQLNQPFIPAPGALALLGMAVLFGSRRRRV